MNSSSFYQQPDANDDYSSAAVPSSSSLRFPSFSEQQQQIHESHPHQYQKHHQSASSGANIHFSFPEENPFASVTRVENDTIGNSRSHRRDPNGSSMVIPNHRQHAAPFSSLSPSPSPSAFRGRQNHQQPRFTANYHDRRIQAERNSRKWLDRNVFDPIEESSTFRKLKQMGKKTSKKRRENPAAAASLGQNQHPYHSQTNSSGPRRFGGSASGYSSWYRPSQYDRPFSRHEAFIESLVNKYIQFKELGSGSDKHRESQLVSDVIDRVEKYGRNQRRQGRRQRRGLYNGNHHGSRLGGNGAVPMGTRRSNHQSRHLVGRNAATDSNDYQVHQAKNAPVEIANSTLDPFRREGITATPLSLRMRNGPFRKHSTKRRFFQPSKHLEPRAAVNDEDGSMDGFLRSKL